MPVLPEISITKTRCICDDTVLSEVNDRKKNYARCLKEITEKNRRQF